MLIQYMLICNDIQNMNLFCNLLALLINGGNIVVDKLNNKMSEPYLCSCDGIVTEVNQPFVELTGFTINNIIGKSLLEIGVMIRINTQMLLDNINRYYSGYIFTNLLSAREVDISLFQNMERNAKVFTFVEIPNTRLDDKLIFEQQTLSDNIVGVSIYSVPDLIMLKVNQKYLEFYDFPYNQEQTSIGLSIREIVTNYTGTQSDVITSSVLKTLKSSYLKEIKFNNFERGITYWDSTRTPIFDHGKLKYMMLTTSESTEKVLKTQRIESQNKQIEQQREQLEQQKDELEEKNRQLNSILENLSEGVMVTDKNGKYIMINSEAKKLIYQSNQLTDLGDSTKYTQYFDLEGISIPYEKLPGVRSLRGERVKNAKMFVKNPDREFYMENSSSPIYNVNGDFTMVVTCFHDITNTIEQSKKIEEQKKELEAIIENISDGISIINSKGQYTLFNKSAREMFHSPNEYLGNIDNGLNQTEYHSISEELIKAENAPYRRIMNGEKFKNMRITVNSPDKTLQLEVSGTPIYDNNGKFSLGVLCSRDMTEYFKHGETIRSKYEFLTRMIDTLHLPVIRLSCPELKIVDINKKAFSIIKLFNHDVKSIRQIKKSKIEDIFKTFETSEYSQCVMNVVQDKKTKYLNKKKHLVNGNELFWNVIFEPILEVNGELKEIIILIIDITDEIKSNIVMEKALELQEEIFANISHELKTPLNVIFSTAQLLNMYSNRGSLDERKDSIIKCLHSIKQNSYRMLKLINNIVDISKIKAGFLQLNLANNDIVELVEEIVMSVINYTEIKGLNIIFDTDTEEKIIACDPQKIERIVLNLISNAIKFSDEGGEILIEIKDRNEYVEISVKDNGIGIEVNDLEMIFDRFKQVDKSLTRNAEGTGIGLSLVKSIVELHGGHIYVESEYGKGSKFIVMLPTRTLIQKSKLIEINTRNTNENIQVEFSDIF